MARLTTQERETFSFSAKALRASQSVPVRLTVRRGPNFLDFSTVSTLDLVPTLFTLVDSFVWCNRVMQCATHDFK